MTSMTAAEVLADHFTSLTVNRIPAKVRQDVTTLLKDYLGVALGGSQTGSGSIAARYAIERGGGLDEATLIGHGNRASAGGAAFANAIASHSIELDDVDVLALFHFSPPVISAALAVAEREGATGAEFLVAAVAGCEMMARLSEATNPSLRNRGYHTTPACGIFGAAVAAGRLMKLGREDMVSALGLAGAQAGGLMEMYGPSMQKRFNPGPAAANGVLAAEMARLGFTGAATILDGERGFCRAFSDKSDLGALTRGLGSEFPIHIEYKPYSSARPIHNAIDCALDIRTQMMGRPTSSIRRISIKRHPDWAHYHLNAAPVTYHEAQVSLPYSVAVALVEGAALFNQYRNEKLADPELHRLSAMIAVDPDAGLPRGVSCLMTLQTEDGAVFRSQVDHPLGSIANPMSAKAMDSKMHSLGDVVIGASTVRRLAERASRIEQEPSVRDVMRLAGGATRRQVAGAL